MAKTSAIDTILPTDTDNTEELAEELQELLQQMTPKRRTLLLSLPEYSWNITEAGLSLGYKDSYAITRLPGIIRGDVVFCRAQQLLLQLVRVKTWSVEGWKQQCLRHQRLARDKGDIATVHAYDADIGRHIGAFEKDNLQRSDKIGIIMR